MPVHTLDGLEVHVDPAIGALQPGYRAGFVVADGLVNGPSNEASERELAAAERHWSAPDRQAGDDATTPPAALGDETAPPALVRATDHPHIAAWRAAFSSFGAKPSRYPCSAEALMSRALGGAGLPRVNLLVDLYNAVSVRHAIPVGGEDLDAVRQPVRLIRATGDEPFEAGPGEVEHPRPGEVVWADAAGVTCRRWNWRQGHRTRLTETTTRAYFLFDALPPLTEEELHAAMTELGALVRATSPDARIRTAIVGP